MSWIKKIAYGESLGKLRQLYDRIKGEDNYIDNILTIHGQRPQTLVGHMALYKNVLHHASNVTPKWVLELLGVYTSMLNGCDYCLAHHFEGLRVLLGDDARAAAIGRALDSGDFDGGFEGVLDARERALLEYAKKLTLTPGEMVEGDVTALKTQGLSEMEILEANQVVSYFAYVNRTALGLGVGTEGDLLGLSPGNADDPDNWRHGEARE